MDNIHEAGTEACQGWQQLGREAGRHTMRNETSRLFCTVSGRHAVVATEYATPTELLRVVSCVC